MTTLKFRSVTFVISLAALVAASASAGAQQHRVHAHQFASISWTATALVPSPAAVLRTHEIDGLGRDADDCVKYGCIDH